ncbi:MAG: hypothetical protein ACO3EZ_03760 [Prochlorotrichaceae cyanobacterium]|jgi:hypothetical protein
MADLLDIEDWNGAKVGYQLKVEECGAPHSSINFFSLLVKSPKIEAILKEYFNFIVSLQSIPPRGIVFPRSEGLTRSRRLYFLTMRT